MSEFFWKYPLGDDTREHAARGVGPSSDYQVPWGRDIHAPFAGRAVTGENPARGKFIEIHGDGKKTVICHLSSIGVRNGQHVTWRSIIGKSGNTGDVRPRPSAGAPYNGSHVHTWVEVNGRRMSFSEWLRTLTPADSGAAAPAPNRTPFADLGTENWYTYPTLEAALNADPNGRQLLRGGGRHRIDGEDRVKGPFKIFIGTGGGNGYHRYVGSRYTNPPVVWL